MKKFVLLATLIFLGIFVTSCDTYAPSQLCGEETEADHEVFTQYFSVIQLFDITDSHTKNNQLQAGRVFEEPATLAIFGSLIKDSEVRLCVFGASFRGEVVFDEVFNFSAGDQSIDLGKYGKGPYIIRIYADGILVENISFIIQ